MRKIEKYWVTRVSKRTYVRTNIETRTGVHKVTNRGNTVKFVNAITRLLLANYLLISR